VEESDVQLTNTGDMNTCGRGLQSKA